MKEILEKLALGNNIFNIKIFDQERECKILNLDLWGFDEGKGRALVGFKEAVKKIVSQEVDNLDFGYGTESTSRYEDVEVDSFEEWVTIGY